MRSAPRPLVARAEWRKWIESQVSSCDLFLYVYTSDCVRQEWLLFEAGVFMGARHQRSANEVGAEYSGNADGNNETSSDLICLKSPGIRTPPKPIEHLQAYEADEKNLERFFVDLLVEGEFTPVNPSTSDFYRITSDRWAKLSKRSLRLLRAAASKASTTKGV